MTNGPENDLYAPPKADLGVTAPKPAAEAGSFDIELALKDAWRTTWAHFGLWLGAGVVLLLLTMLSAITLIGYFVVVPVLVWGGIKFLLNLHDGTAQFGDIFSGFSNYLGNLGRTLLLGILILALGVLVQSGVFIGQALDSDAITGVGYVVYVALSIAVLLRLYFSFFIMVDQDLPALEALAASWNATRGRVWDVFLLSLVSGLIGLLGVLAFVVGIIITMTISSLMWASAYRQMYPLQTSAALNGEAKA